MEADELKKLAKKFGKKASWAVWDDSDKNDTEIIFTKAAELQTQYVFIGLNLSKEVDTWANFHGGKHDWKLSKAFNHHAVLRGSYMTDLIFKVEKQSLKIQEYFADEKNATDVKKQIECFRKELKEVGIKPGCTFILFGKQVQNYLTFFLDEIFYSSKRIKLPHYSSRNSKWVECAIATINKELTKP